MAKRKQVRLAAPIKLNLGCGKNRLDGWVNADQVQTAATDVVCDLATTPWPWPDSSVEEAQAIHLLEHLDGKQRTVFANELWRVLKVGATCTIIVPYWSSMRAVQDPTHRWPPLCEASFLYWNRPWREQNGLDAYLGLSCHFNFTYGYVLPPETANRQEEARTFAIGHYTNAVSDLQIVLTKEA